MTNTKRITFLKDFIYDEEMVVKAGTYEYVNVDNRYVEVLINGEWYDFCDLESLEYVIEK